MDEYDFEAPSVCSFIRSNLTQSLISKGDFNGTKLFSDEVNMALTFHVEMG